MPRFHNIDAGKRLNMFRLSDLAVNENFPQLLYCPGHPCCGSEKSDSMGIQSALSFLAATAMEPASTSGAASVSGSHAMPSPALTIASNVAARSAVNAIVSAVKFFLICPGLLNQCINFLHVLHSRDCCVTITNNVSSSVVFHLPPILSSACR